MHHRRCIVVLPGSSALERPRSGGEAERSTAPGAPGRRDDNRDVARKLLDKLGDDDPTVRRAAADALIGVSSRL